VRSADGRGEIEEVSSMSIYHLSVKTVSRSSGRSSTGAAAYRSATKIVDQRLGIVHDYSRKKGVEFSQIVLPFGAPESFMERSVLWNAAEASETRKNSVVAREFEVALPSEISPEQRVELVRDLAKSISDRHMVGVDFVIHAPGKEGDQRNHHAHVLCTTRRLWAGGFGEKSRELDDQKLGEVAYWRKKWEDLENRALERAGVKARVSCRSLEDQGLQHQPAFPPGPSITGILRRGEASHVLQRVDLEASRRLEEIQKERMERDRLEREIPVLEKEIEGLYQDYAMEFSGKALKDVKEDLAASQRLEIAKREQEISDLAKRQELADLRETTLGNAKKKFAREEREIDRSDDSDHSIGLGM
jgi:ATP-dependent exoDNAse (exonuclease V) alpha subunit